jgi:hypothetical protein
MAPRRSSLLRAKVAVAQRRREKGLARCRLAAVCSLAAYYRRSPDELSEKEVRAYLLSLRERSVARGTFKTVHYGIQFLYCTTLNRDRALFSKRDPRAQAGAFAQCPGARSAPFSPAKELYFQDLLRHNLRLRPTVRRSYRPRDPHD